MIRRSLHRIFGRFRRLRPWYFLVITILAGCMAVISLRANNQHMIQLRDAVYTADKDINHVEASLRALQTYVVSHMNTNLSGGNNAVYPPVQLKYTYDRLVQAESDALAQSNSAFYTMAQKYCEAQNPEGFYGATRIGCVENYLTTHDTQHQLTPIPDALYKFAFVSPQWSPDVAGWSLAVASFSGFLAVLLLIVRRFGR